MEACHYHLHHASVCIDIDNDFDICNDFVIINYHLIKGHLELF